jgi:hypothetical protein
MRLVKFKQPSNEDMIVNTASLAFVQATLETGEEPESENDLVGSQLLRYLVGREELPSH